MLRLTLQNARLADDAGDARPAQAVDGVSAITRAIVTEDGVVRIDNITQPELIGKPRCFNFWRRGACRNPVCRFAHA
jgi:hypothetical protein